MLTSSEFKVCGAIGNCNSLGKKSNNVAETEIGQVRLPNPNPNPNSNPNPNPNPHPKIGQGNTNAWSIGGLDEDTTVALY